MPNYDYKCLKCGETFEMLQAPKAPAPKCLECGHPETQKLLSPPAVIFKGSGFYKTDSKGGTSASVGTEKKVEKSEKKTESKGDGVKKNDDKE